MPAGPASPLQRALLGLALGLGSGAGLMTRGNVAYAGNEAHVRTPVLWPNECARIIDRSVDPVAHFDYAIPVEDTEVTADELVDSRTHQFLALCREHPSTELLPSWITRDDVDRSLAAGLLEPGTELGAEAILDESPSWAGCFVRVTADDARRPIAFDVAAQGVDWDTTGVEAGVWSLAGYTFEPALNLWRERPGFIKIVDDRDDPEQDLPALALLGDEQLVDPGAAVVVDACVDLLGPGTIELEWAEFQPALSWRAWTSVAVEADGPVQLELPAPSAAADRTILVRARLTDALGRTREAHLAVALAVGPCPASGCEDEPDPEPEPIDREASGGRCAATSDSRGLAWAVFGFGILVLRRRARSRRVFDRKL